MRINFYSIFTCCALSVFATESFAQVTPGCTDPDAVNYNIDADEDDGSCEYLVSPLNIDLNVFATGLSSPVAMTHAGDERLFVCEQTSGRVRILDENGSIIGTLINVSSDINGGGERGLLGIAFHPDFDENGYFYLNYTNNSNDTEIIRYTVSEEDPNVADDDSGLIILQIEQPYLNHNAGSLAFGPDGYLYIPMGDGGDGGDPDNNAQTRTEMLGKVLRIDVNGDDFPGDSDRNYSIPADNPFVDDSTTLDEIWAIGTRNPWKFSFDRETGDLWMGDVGQNAYEEVNFQPASSTGGENYGWRCFEGFHNYNTSNCQSFENYTAPVAEFDQDDYGWCSVIGGYVYRGSEYPLLEGRFLMTDYCRGDFYTLHQNSLGEWVQELVDEDYAGPFQGFTGFGEDVNGELYTFRSNGTVYKIEEVCSASIPEITVDEALLTSSPGESYQWLLNGLLIEGATNQTYTVEANGDYSVVVDAGNGCVVESEAVTIFVTSVVDTGIRSLSLSPNPGTGLVNLRAKLSRQGEMNVQVFDQTGRFVDAKAIGGVSGHIHQPLDFSHLSEGIYLVKVNLGEYFEMHRLVIVR